LIIRSVEFFPGRLLPSVCSSFSNVSTKFLTAFADPSSLEYIFIAKDLGGFAAIIGGLANYFLGHPEATIGVLGLLGELNKLLTTIVQRSLYRQGSHFAELISQVYGGWSALLPWVEVHIGSNGPAGSEQTTYSARQAVLDVLVPPLDVLAGLLSAGANGDEVTAAMMFFEMLSSTIRVPQLQQVAGVQWLMTNAQAVGGSLNTALHVSLYTALSCILILPCKPSPSSAPSSPSVAASIPKPRQKDDQNWEERATAFETLVRCLLDQIKNLEHLKDPQQLTNQDLVRRVNQAFRTLAGITTRVGEKGSKESKQILVGRLGGTIQMGVPLLRFFSSHRQMTIVEGLTELFIALFDTFKTHLGLPFIQETMMAFIGVLGGDVDKLRFTFTSSDPATAAVATRFLHLIQHVVRDSSSQLHNLVLDIRQLLFALPHAQLGDEVAAKYYEVLYELVLKHWNTTDSSGQSVLAPSITMLCEALAKKSGIDVTLLVQILKWLRELGKRVKLFERAEFVQTGLRWQLSVLLLDMATSLNNSVASLSEEASEVLYDVALVDFKVFFQEMLPRWIDQQSGLSIDQKRHLFALFRPDTDLPSFLAHLQDLITDITFFRLVNSPPSLTL